MNQRANFAKQGQGQRVSEKYSKMSSTAKKAEVNRLIGKLIQVRKNKRS
ncbi:hypothetical protein MAL02_19520 (plasmid) [Leptospira noguchii]|nr:hypothetical protein [Leptospira noguchii]UOG36327.1 hypothetical protein MAL02_19520 [Leptospira noguchii]